MTKTDLIIFALGIFFFLHGWQKGFWGTILGPIALIATLIVSNVLYAQTHNLILVLIVGLFGPFFLKAGLKMIFQSRAKGNEDKPSGSVLGNILGGVANLTWQGFFVLLGLFVIGIFPEASSGWIQQTQQDIHQSKSYAVLQSFLNKADSSRHGTKRTFWTKPNKNITQTREFRTLMADERMVALVQDKETRRQLETKDVKKLLLNPKFQSVLQDPQLMKKILAVYHPSS